MREVFQSVESQSVFDTKGTILKAGLPDLNPHSGVLKALESNWQAEMKDYATYTALAAREQNARRRNVIRGLAAAEKHHADLWAARMRALGGPDPAFLAKSTGVAESLEKVAGGGDLTLRRLRIEERKDIEKYRKQLADLDDQPSQPILHEIIADENEHYKALSSLIRSRRPLPVLAQDEAKRALDQLLAARRKQHPEPASWINDAIYAANDGLGSIFGVVSGVAGATLGKSHYILIAGLAGMVAGALSAGTGAYLAAKSQREIFDAGLARERSAVKHNEAEAREVLALSYQIRGLPEDVAGRLVHLLSDDKEQLVHALARARGSIDEGSLGNPWLPAFRGALATAIGAFVPIVPFFFLAGVPAIIVAAILSLAAHFAVGAAKSVMTIRPWWSTGLELTAIGAVEGLVTFAIGMGLADVGGAH